LAIADWLFLFPEKKENCLAMEKEGVGAVIDVLAAKVPQVEAHTASEILKINVGPDKVKFDSVGCRNPFVKNQPLEPASAVGISDREPL
jgi:hypothetical protein